MNQIIYIKQDNSYINDVPKKKHLLKTFFQFQLLFCSIIVLSTSIYYGYNLYNKYQKENISKKLINNFNITRLYANGTYNAINTANSENFYKIEDNSFNVIGLIEINVIGINYPILSTINNDLLKIAPCRFFGPLPNEVGNMCIAGHNYNNYKFFSKLKKLVVGDIINIYDLSRKENRIFCL